MPSNNRKIEVGWLAGRFPGRLGFLFPPNGWSIPPKWMKFACDNGAFSTYKNNTEWDENAFLMLLSKAKSYNPMWVAVPDVVADKDKTIEQWHRWVGRLSEFTLAFVVQDGMVAQDVPKKAGVIFVGGTTSWKWRTAPKWCADFPRVHIGRVNNIS